MGLLNKLLGGGAEGCRESMRDAYEHHAKAARAKHMDSPHLIGLYGALRSRYRARGLAMDEAVMWGELAPFLAMEPAMSIVALSEYVAFQEQHAGVRREWLGNTIRRAMQAPKVGTMTEVVRLAVVSRVAWCELLEPATVAALEGEPDTEGESAAQAQRQTGVAAERHERRTLVSNRHDARGRSRARRLRRQHGPRPTGRAPAVHGHVEHASSRCSTRRRTRGPG